MREINLLKSLPVCNRNVKKRADAKLPEVVAESKKFGQLYFDGPREYGYGGYKYDGRWRPVARDIVEEYSLEPGQKILDIGCAKGFLVKDLLNCCPGLEAFGLDISNYAVMNSHADVVGRLHIGNALSLPFPQDSFDCVLAINVLHNLRRPNVINALKEIQRVLKPNGNSFVQVDAYRNEAEKSVFEDWVLTAEFYGYPNDWLDVFNAVGYRGDYYWTILEVDS